MTSAPAGTRLENVPRETVGKLERFSALLKEENSRQNLIARSTVDDIWERHVADSAQLLRFAPADRAWVDVGSGAGLPGLVLAVMGVGSIVLVEPRRLRAEFLERCAEQLNLSNVEVVADKIDRVSARADVITARAVAPLSKLLMMTHHLSHAGTSWVLPKGRSGEMELAEARSSWQGRFRVEPSITDRDAVIIIASEVQPRRKGQA